MSSRTGLSGASPQKLSVSGMPASVGQTSIPNIPKGPSGSVGMTSPSSDVTNSLQVGRLWYPFLDSSSPYDANPASHFALSPLQHPTPAPVCISGASSSSASLSSLAASPSAATVREYTSKLKAIEQWRFFCIDFEKFRTEHGVALKAKVRAGIPDCLRGVLWQKLARARRNGSGATVASSTAAESGYLSKPVANSSKALAAKAGDILAAPPPLQPDGSASEADGTTAVSVSSCSNSSFFSSGHTATSTITLPAKATAGNVAVSPSIATVSSSISTQITASSVAGGTFSQTLLTKDTGGNGTSPVLPATMSTSSLVTPSPVPSTSIADVISSGVASTGAVKVAGRALNKNSAHREAPAKAPEGTFETCYSDGTNTSDQAPMPNSQNAMATASNSWAVSSSSSRETSGHQTSVTTPVTLSDSKLNEQSLLSQRCQDDNTASLPQRPPPPLSYSGPSPDDKRSCQAGVAVDRRQVTVAPPLSSSESSEETQSEDTQAQQASSVLSTAEQSQHQQAEWSSHSCAADILRDISRTFPKHVLFRDRGSSGQESLFNVLHWYALHNPEVGYCQGMGFLTGLLLMYMNERDAFDMLVMLLGTYQMDGLFKPGLPLLNLYFFQFQKLLNAHLPKLAEHFRREHVDVSMFASQWFMTLFTYNFSFEVVVRIWDVFLHQGIKTIFRVALAILKLMEQELYKESFEGILYRLKCSANCLDVELLLQTALGIKLRYRTLQQLHRMYLDINGSDTT